MKSLISIAAFAIMLSASAYGQTRVGLTRVKSEAEQQWPHPILSRELMRQATLLAARIGLGLAVGDAVLGESVDGSGTVTLSPDFAFPRYDRPNPKPPAFTLWKAGESKPLFSIELKRDAWIYYPPDAVVLAEELSRTKLVDALKKAGLNGTSRAIDRAGAVDSQALAAVDNFSCSAS
jgi:hypothetical protein